MKSLTNSTESYWHFNKIAYQFIIPEHIFNRTGFPSYSRWNVWNPVFNIYDPHVVSGPFTVTDFDAGVFYELSANHDYHYYPDFKWPPCPYPPPTSTTTLPSSPIVISLIMMVATASTSSLIAIGIAIRKGWISNKTN